MKLTVPQMAMLGHAGHYNYEKVKTKSEQEEKPTPTKDDGKWESFGDNDAAKLSYIMGI